ncbi:MAG: mechanosensitive ion channel family protein, partial [Methanobrevibacter sp.]|nr:mechanosensitive ion channel family protein [Methanobrevibacter sp.]
MLFLDSFSIIISLLIIIIATFIISKILTIIINKLKRNKRDMTLVYLIIDLIHYIVYIIAILLIFEVFGIDLTSIFVSIGIVGISVGFAAKDIISNFMSGIFLISDKSVKVGDTLEVSGIKGKI